MDDSDDHSTSINISTSVSCSYYNYSSNPSKLMGWIFYIHWKQRKACKEKCMKYLMAAGMSH